MGENQMMRQEEVQAELPLDIPLDKRSRLYPHHHPE